MVVDESRNVWNIYHLAPSTMFGKNKSSTDCECVPDSNASLKTNQKITTTTTEGAAFSGQQPMSAIGVAAQQPLMQQNLQQTSSINQMAAKSMVAERTVNAETMTIPLAEEQLEIRKVMREVPAVVGVRKEVQEQMVSVNVPVQRETVVIERRPYTGTALPNADAFRGQEVLVQTKVEDVEVIKRPVIREEVVLRKDYIQESKPIVDTLRREDIVEIGTKQMAAGALNTSSTIQSSSMAMDTSLAKDACGPCPPGTHPVKKSSFM